MGTSVRETFNVAATITTRDADEILDHLNLNSDTDGIADVIEAGTGSPRPRSTPTDTDGDGIADVVDDVVGFKVNDADIDDSGDFTLADTDGDAAADCSGATPMTADFDFRDATGNNFAVEGTASDDLIDGSDTDDPDGDLVDNNDHSDSSNDDSIVTGLAITQFSAVTGRRRSAATTATTSSPYPGLAGSCLSPAGGRLG